MTATAPLAEPLASAPQRSSADRFVRRMLRLPADAPKASPRAAEKAFQTSVMVSAVRCTLMYVVFPFVLPALGIAAGAAPAVGIPIAVLAMCFIVMSMRRFFRADHSKRWHYMVLGSCMLGLLAYTLVHDIVSVVS